MTTDAGRRLGHRSLLRLWSLREDVRPEEEPESGDVLLHNPWGTERVPNPRPVAREALRRMSFGPISLDNVLAGVEGREAAAEELAALTQRINHLLVSTLRFDDSAQPLLSVLAASPRASMEPAEAEPDRLYRLSRFASMRTEGDGFTLESPLSLYRALLHQGDAVALVGAFGRPTTLGEAAAATRMPESAVREVLSDLTAAGLTIAADQKGFAEDRDPVLISWSAIDLLFHTRSTLGRHDNDFGATYALADRIPPEPGLRPPRPGRRVPLPRPTPDTDALAGTALAELLEAGPASSRGGQGTPTAQQLGEMLFRSMRVLSLGADGGPMLYEVTERPYPGVDGCYPLELYLSVDRCDGLDRGVYHYDPLNHSLVLVNENDETLGGLLRHAQISVGVAQAQAPVLVTLTARFLRVAWKFAGLGHALVLREAGVALQTMNLVGASVGLSVSSLDLIDIDADARAFGLDWRTESTVGGLLLTGTVRERAGS